MVENCHQTIYKSHHTVESHIIPVTHINVFIITQTYPVVGIANGFQRLETGPCAANALGNWDRGGGAGHAGAGHCSLEVQHDGL